MPNQIDECPACNPTAQEIEAITAVVYDEVYDQAFDAAVEAYTAVHPFFEPGTEDALNPQDGFVLLLQRLLDGLMDQAIHSRLHCTASVAGHKVELN